MFNKKMRAKVRKAKDILEALQNERESYRRKILDLDAEIGKAETLIYAYEEAILVHATEENPISPKTRKKMRPRSRVRRSCVREAEGPRFRQGSAN